ncbi:MAG: asparaginase domain-containing protein [Chloroflexota bacterium]
MKIKVFTTGGSIDKAYSTQSSSFEVGEPQVASILCDANAAFEYEIEPLLRKDSLEITPAERAALVDRVRSDPHHYILITHGTDSMIATGLALADIPGKVIVLTGAMQPAEFRHTDAHFNLGGAITALQTLPEGVYIVMNGQVFDPQYAKKNLAQNRFETRSR